MVKHFFRTKRSVISFIFLIIKKIYISRSIVCKIYRVNNDAQNQNQQGTVYGNDDDDEDLYG